MKHSGPLEIMLVEDNPADQEIARRVFGAEQGRCALEIVRDGQQALDKLEGRPAISDRSALPQPDLILMDINMPRLSGIDVLRRMKQNEELRHIPVLMLTTSTYEMDVHESYRLGCSSYILKPVDVPQFKATLHQLLEYWTTLSALPMRIPAPR